MFVWRNEAIPDVEILAVHLFAIIMIFIFRQMAPTSMVQQVGSFRA